MEKTGTFEKKIDLETLGWNPAFRAAFDEYRAQGYAPGRISRKDKSGYMVYSEFGELTAGVPGKMMHKIDRKSELPAVGDWVALELRLKEGNALIHAVLPRKGCFTRNIPSAGSAVTEEQVIVANVDTVFLVTAMDRDFNLRRLERYITLAYNSGADPVIILNKSDLCENVAGLMLEVETVAPGVPVHAVCATREEGLDSLHNYMGEGKAIALIGSSGVGKSTLINRFLGEEKMKVSALGKRTGKGRHTTTHRELVLLHGGGMLIDSPGMRELQLWGSEELLETTFKEIDTLSAECRFNDCGHIDEPGCAVREAVEKGLLDRERFISYFKQKNEIKLLEEKRIQKERIIERARNKRFKVKSKKEGFGEKDYW
ncbi:MAG: ribosome small subunit-dependent GTPase A [bacterium]|nr:ribosome small subunit-dependent GTPase A [bacterium]